MHNAVKRFYALVISKVAIRGTLVQFSIISRHFRTVYFPFSRLSNTTAPFLAKLVSLLPIHTTRNANEFSGIIPSVDTRFEEVERVVSDGFLLERDPPSCSKPL